MNQSHTYQVSLKWLGDRKGIVQSEALNKSIEVATPPEFPKGIPGIWSPEHLFVAAINSCFMTTFLAIAENSKLEFHKFECNAIGTLEKTEGKFRITEVTLFPELTVDNENIFEKAIRVMEMSEKGCLISNSVNSKINLQPEIKMLKAI
jgi:peroxiredoxin-like protein